jgi:hypothetical protein
MTKLIVAFRKFANASKNLKVVTLQTMKAYGVRAGSGLYLHSLLSYVTDRVRVCPRDSIAVLSERDPIRIREGAV